MTGISGGFAVKDDIKLEGGSYKQDEGKKDEKEIKVDGFDVNLIDAPVTPGDDTEELAIFFMQISAPTKATVWKNFGNVALAGASLSLLISPIKTIMGAPKKIWEAGTTCYKFLPLCAGIILIAGGVVQGTAINNRAVSLSKCEDVLLSGEQARTGCSVVRVTNYDYKDISKYCGVIEGFP